MSPVPGGNRQALALSLGLPREPGHQLVPRLKGGPTYEAGLRIPFLQPTGLTVSGSSSPRCPHHAPFSSESQVVMSPFFR